MASGDSVQFKVTFNKGGQTVEIRRFSIEKDVVTNYSYLRQKLYSIFPALQSTGMTVSWIDSENDVVMIGSDEELIIALTEMEGLHKKLIVNLVTPNHTQGAAANRPDNHPKILHEGVTCDGCENVVTGYRYKCISCPDFDLCFDCEQKGMHPEHIMIRYPFPVTRDFHFMKKLKKLHRRFDHHASFCEPPFHGHNHPRFGPKAYRCPAMSEDIFYLVDDFVTALRTQVDIVTPEIIQQVIESLSNMNLSGLNVPNANQDSSPNTPSTEKKHDKKKDKEERPGKKRGCPFTERRGSFRAGAKDIQPPPLANIISNVMQQVGAVAPHAFPNLVAALNHMAGGPSQSTNPTGAGDAATPSTSNGANPQPQSPSQPDSEPMVIILDDEISGNNSSQAEANAAPQTSSIAATTSSPSAPPNISEPSQTSSGFDQLIDRQLSTMLNMGFNNKDGWLRTMLVLKNGDITKVLDQLSGNNVGSSSSRLELD